LNAARLELVLLVLVLLIIQRFLLKAKQACKNINSIGKKAMSKMSNAGIE